MKSLIFTSIFTLAFVCLHNEIYAGFRIKNSDSVDITFWYRKPGDKGWQPPQNLAKDEQVELEIPAGVYQFCILGPTKVFKYTSFSPYDAGGTYLVGIVAAAPCAAPTPEVEHDDDTQPCKVETLPSLDPEPERPEGRIALGVNVKLCDKGIHVDSVSIGMPAEKCFDRRTGEAIKLEAEDHIVSVNGIKPKSVAQFISLIQNSQRQIELKVLDRRTGMVRHLSTRLW